MIQGDGNGHGVDMNRMNFISNFKRKRKGAVRMATGKWLVVDTKYVGVWSRGSGASLW